MSRDKAREGATAEAYLWYAAGRGEERNTVAGQLCNVGVKKSLQRLHKRAVSNQIVADPQVFEKAVLLNGLRIVTEEIPGSRTLSLGVWIGTGSRAEKAGQSGSAHFIEHLLFKGTRSRTASALAREIDSIGGHLDAFTSREYTFLYLNLLVESVERGMTILSDILLHATFPPTEMERERQVILEEIKMNEDNPEDSVYELLVQNLWRKNPLGRPVLGRAGTVKAVTRSQLLSFCRRHYRSSNLVLAAAGGLGHRRLEGLWRRYFSLPRRETRPLRNSPPRFSTGFYFKKRDLEQTYLCFGTRGLSQSHPERYALYVMNSILGGSMSSRLFQEVREKRGLAYSIYSAYSSYRDTGLFAISVGTSPHLAPRVVQLVERQIDRICSRAPSAAEVSRAQDNLKGNIILGLESSGHRMMKLAKQEIYFGRQFGIDDTIRGIEAVTPQQVYRLARELFRPECSAWAAVGPEHSLEKIAGGRR